MAGIGQGPPAAGFPSPAPAETPTGGGAGPHQTTTPLTTPRVNFPSGWGGAHGAGSSTQAAPTGSSQTTAVSGAGSSAGIKEFVPGQREFVPGQREFVPGGHGSQLFAGPPPPSSESQSQRNGVPQENYYTPAPFPHQAHHQAPVNNDPYSSHNLAPQTSSCGTGDHGNPRASLGGSRDQPGRASTTLLSAAAASFVPTLGPPAEPPSAAEPGFEPPPKMPVYRGASERELDSDLSRCAPGAREQQHIVGGDCHTGFGRLGGGTQTALGSNLVPQGMGSFLPAPQEWAQQHVGVLPPQQHQQHVQLLPGVQQHNGFGDPGPPYAPQTNTPLGISPGGDQSATAFPQTPINHTTKTSYGNPQTPLTTEKTDWDCWGHNSSGQNNDVWAHSGLAQACVDGAHLGGGVDGWAQTARGTPATTALTAGGLPPSTQQNLPSFLSDRRGAAPAAAAPPQTHRDDVFLEFNSPKNIDFRQDRLRMGGFGSTSFVDDKHGWTTPEALSRSPDGLQFCGGTRDKVDFPHSSSGRANDLRARETTGSTTLNTPRDDSFSGRPDAQDDSFSHTPLYQGYSFASRNHDVAEASMVCAERTASRYCERGLLDRSMESSNLKESPLDRSLESGKELLEVLVSSCGCGVFVV